MVKSAAVDIFEFGRFILSGIASTVGNIGAVWLALFFVTFKIALLAGIVSGLTISFALSKLFVFGSRSWERAHGEAARFLIVYGIGCAVYWAVALLSERFGLLHSIAPKMEEVGDALIGSGMMMLTSYFGHRFFTYRAYQRSADSPSDVSQVSASR